MTAETDQRPERVLRNGTDIAAGRGRILWPVLLEVGFHKMTRSTFLALELIGLRRNFRNRHKDLLLCGSITEGQQLPGSMEDDSLGLGVELLLPA
jgi:hypothetical protein